MIDLRKDLDSFAELRRGIQLWVEALLFIYQPSHPHIRESTQPRK
jgi:hypothetical protein